MTYVRVYQTWSISYGATDNTHGPDSGGATRERRAEGDDTSSMRERLQQERVQRGLSVHALADRIGCDAATVAAVERGDAPLTLDLQRSLMRALGMKRTDQ